MRAKIMLIVSAAAALAVHSTPAKAYEEDTHFTVCYVACRSAGFTDAEALTIARNEQGMDDSDGTVGNSGIIPKPPEELYWHAFGYKSDGCGQATMILDMKRWMFNWAMRGATSD